MLPVGFDKEVELESSIAEVKAALFGESRIYLELKKLIGERGKTQNIPDGYLIDLSSPKKPVLYLVEAELAKHDPLRHIAKQLLNFSLSFKSTPQKMKGLLREHLLKSPETVKRCEGLLFKMLVWVSASVECDMSCWFTLPHFTIRIGKIAGTAV